MQFVKDGLEASTGKVAREIPEILLMLGLFLFVPVGCVSAVHTLYTVSRYNKLAAK